MKESDRLARTVRSTQPPRADLTERGKSQLSGERPRLERSKERVEVGGLGGCDCSYVCDLPGLCSEDQLAFQAYLRNRQSPEVSNVEATYGRALGVPSHPVLRDRQAQERKSEAGIDRIQRYSG